MTSKNEIRKLQRKQRRCQVLISTETGIPCVDHPTENLLICNAGLSTGLQQEILLSEMNKFGQIKNIVMLPGKSYCYVQCDCMESAQRIYEQAHGRLRLGQGGGVLYLSFSETVPHVQNPWTENLPEGLILLKDFIDVQEETDILNVLKWDNGNDVSNESMLKNRQVKHFGYEFKYGTNTVDPNCPLNDGIPPILSPLWPRIIRHLPELTEWHRTPEQCTVNKYEPGQGIPFHCDTHSAFSDSILSLSLASDIVMEFRHANDCRHVYILLPQRSLLVMTGECRFGWSHGIRSRTMDIVPNQTGGLTILKRQLRVSLTFRNLKMKPCHCSYPKLCDTQKVIESRKNQIATDESPAILEQENVHRVYNEIANHFSETRHSPWPLVDQFIQSIAVGSILLDVGCGNGKYLNINQSIVNIGCDRSDGLLRVCRNRNLMSFQCDCLSLPIRSESVDACISIAVIHHLATDERRLQSIREMCRTLRVGGRALIYVWAKNQEADSRKSSYLRQAERNKPSMENDDVKYSGKLPVHTNRTQFEHQDILVPWKLKVTGERKDSVGEPDNLNKTFLRYYHVYEKGELEEMCKQIDGIFIEKNYYDQGNWCVILQKTK